MRRMPRPGHDVARVSPDEVGCRAVRIDPKPFLPFNITGKRPRMERSLAWVAPTMQEKEPRPIRIEEQVVEPMFCTGQKLGLLFPRIRHLHGIGKAEEQFSFSARHLHPP